jgi:hypothetical protein
MLLPFIVRKIIRPRFTIPENNPPACRDQRKNAPIRKIFSPRQRLLSELLAPLQSAPSWERQEQLLERMFTTIVELFWKFS